MINLEKVISEVHFEKSNALIKASIDLKKFEKFVELNVPTVLYQGDSKVLWKDVKVEVERSGQVRLNANQGVLSIYAPVLVKVMNSKDSEIAKVNADISGAIQFSLTENWNAQIHIIDIEIIATDRTEIQIFSTPISISGLLNTLFPLIKAPLKQFLEAQIYELIIKEMSIEDILKPLNQWNFIDDQKLIGIALTEKSFTQFPYKLENDRLEIEILMVARLLMLNKSSIENVKLDNHLPALNRRNEKQFQPQLELLHALPFNVLQEVVNKELQSNPIEVKGRMLHLQILDFDFDDETQGCLADVKVSGDISGVIHIVAHLKFDDVTGDLKVIVDDLTIKSGSILIRPIFALVKGVIIDKIQKMAELNLNEKLNVLLEEHKVISDKIELPKQFQLLFVHQRAYVKYLKFDPYGLIVSIHADGYFLFEMK